jgi:hypothetical protein
MPTPPPEPFHCRRAGWCAEWETVRDPVTGDHTGRIGARLEQADGLCPVCTAEVGHALRHLPGDVAELTSIIGRPLSSALREPITGPKLGPRMPIREDIEALRTLIIHEVCSCARAVARDADVSWDRFDEEHSRIGDRVQRACQLLTYRLPRFLDLGPTEYRARSLGVRRTDGHDPDTTTRYGDDYWITRDGVDSAISLLGLHRRAYIAAQRHTTLVPVYGYCPNCGRGPEVLRRELGKGHADCKHCHHRVSEQWCDVLKTAAANCHTDRDVAVLTEALRSPRAA